MLSESHEFNFIRALYAIPTCAFPPWPPTYCVFLGKLMNSLLHFVSKLIFRWQLSYERAARRRAERL